MIDLSIHNLRKVFWREKKKRKMKGSRLSHFLLALCVSEEEEGKERGREGRERRVE